MIRTSANPLFGMQSNPTSTRPTLEPGALPFGDMLSREIDARQQNPAAAPTRSTPARADHQSDITQQSQQSLRRQAAGATGAIEQVRQDSKPTQQAEGLQRRHDPQHRPDAKRSQPADDTSRQTGTGGIPRYEPARRDGDQTSKTKTKSADTDGTGNTASGGDATGSPALTAPNVCVDSSASQALYSARPDKANEANINALLDPNAGNDKLAALGTHAADPGINAVADKPDVALDALLAQAAQQVQAHDGPTAAGVKSSSATPGLKPAALALAGNSNGIRTALSGVETVLPTAMSVQSGSDAAADNIGAPPTKDPAPAALPGTPAVAMMLANGLRTGTTAAANVLTPHVGTNAWDNALGQKVVWMATGAEQTASLTLNPPDLGPLQVVINVSNSHAEATFTAAQPEVRQALEAALPKLKEMMADAGISLGQTSVNAGSPKQNETSQQHGSASQPGGRGGLSDNVGTGDVDGISRNRARAVGGGNSLVDIFA